MTGIAERRCTVHIGGEPFAPDASIELPLRKIGDAILRMVVDELAQRHDTDGSCLRCLLDEDVLCSESAGTLVVVGPAGKETTLRLDREIIKLVEIGAALSGRRRAKGRAPSTRPRAALAILSARDSSAVAGADHPLAS